MGTLTYAMELMPKWPLYKLSHIRLVKPPMPTTVTFSVTHVCQSLCKTCNIGRAYFENPRMREKELKLDEIEKVFQSIGHVFYFNISGGEPFLRTDLPEIVGLACKYLTPLVIHTPTNALMPQYIEKQTRRILDIMREHKSKAAFTIKPSFDGVGEKHDFVRGVKGNFKSLMETIRRLKELQKEYPELHIGLGTVISKLNLNDIPETVEFAEKQDLNTYINEVAENRSEMFNFQDDITPSADEYEKVVGYFSKRIKENIPGKKALDTLIQAFRLYYYQFTVRVLREKTQVIPCYSGIANIHINSYGDVWPCSILAYTQNMGNLRDVNYDFKKIWYSKRADEVRRFVYDKKCHCPMAGAAYNSIFMSLRAMSRVIFNAISLTAAKQKTQTTQENNTTINPTQNYHKPPQSSPQYYPMNTS